MKFTAMYSELLIRGRNKRLCTGFIKSMFTLTYLYEAGIMAHPHEEQFVQGKLLEGQWFNLPSFFLNQINWS